MAVFYLYNLISGSTYLAYIMVVLMFYEFDIKWLLKLNY